MENPVTQNADPWCTSSEDIAAVRRTFSVPSLLAFRKGVPWQACLAGGTEAVRYLERGVYTLVREGRCRAIGIPFDMSASGEADVLVRHAVILLEHQDGSAYRIQLPYSDNGSIQMPQGDLVVVLTEPKFFLRPRFP